MEENHHHILMNTNSLRKQRSSDEINDCNAVSGEEPDNLDAHAWLVVTQRRINDPKILKHDI